MELWNLYDKDRVLTKETMVRGDEMKKDMYHLVVHVVIINSENQMLIQQRQWDKIGAPGLWDITVGGSVLAGETSQEGAIREISEGLGIELDLNQRPHLSVTFDHGYDDIYIVNQEVELDSLKIPNDEVLDTKWASIDEIYEMIDNKSFINYRKSLIQLLFDMRYSYGGKND